MTGSRRLSQAISEGDGISVLVHVGDAEAARDAEAQGAEGIVVVRKLPGVREATSLPILWRAEGPRQARDADADACVLVVAGLDDEGDGLEELHAQALALGLECVVEVHDEEELALALERIDPEIFLLSAGGADDGEEALERVLDLLPDVPAGKLAIAEVAVSRREEVVALERAGIDAVLVGTGGNLAELVGGAPPQV